MIRGYNDFIGLYFGDLKVLSKDENKKRSYFYCQCSCGTVKTIYGFHLKSNKIKSCGCKSNRAIGKNNPTFSGYEEISGSYWRKLKDGAKSRNLEFDIQLKYVWDLFLDQERKCKLSGIRLYFNSKFITKDGNASLDRIDSSKGYIEGNVQWVDKNVNKLKGNLSDKELIKFANLISNHNKNND